MSNWSKCLQVIWHKGIIFLLSEIKVKDLIYNAPLRTYNTCHSFMVFKYPKSNTKEYEKYLETKSKTLIMLFGKNKQTKNPKGIVKLKN